MKPAIFLILFFLVFTYSYSILAVPTTGSDIDYFKRRFRLRVEESIKQQFHKLHKLGNKKDMLLKNLRELLDKKEKTI